MGGFDSEDVMSIGYFDFVGWLRMLKHKGQELALYPDDIDNVHIQLTTLDHDECRAFNAKEIVSLKAIEKYKRDHNCALCDIVIRLMNQLDRQPPAFKHYTERVGNQDDK